MVLMAPSEVKGQSWPIVCTFFFALVQSLHSDTKSELVESSISLRKCGKSFCFGGWHANCMTSRNAGI